MNDLSRDEATVATVRAALPSTGFETIRLNGWMMSGMLKSAKERLKTERGGRAAGFAGERPGGVRRRTRRAKLERPRAQRSMAAQRAAEMHAALNKQFSEQEAEKDRLLEALANATKPKAIAVEVEAEKPAEVALPDYQLIKDQAESMKRSPCLL